VEQEELPEAQRAARRGRSPSSGRWARCGRRVRSAQTAGDAKRKQGEEPESECRSTRRNTNKAGTGPPHGVWTTVLTTICIYIFVRVHLDVGLDVAQAEEQIAENCRLVKTIDIDI